MHMEPWFNISLFRKMWAGNNLNKPLSVCLSSLANGFCFQGSLFSCINQIHFVHFFFIVYVAACSKVGMYRWPIVSGFSLIWASASTYTGAHTYARPHSTAEFSTLSLAPFSSTLAQCCSGPHVNLFYRKGQG